MGAMVLELEEIGDERGFFARTWCKEEFLTHGLDVNLSQCSVSFNYKKGTIRGMHFQVPPHAETKLVRCTRGRIFDVIIDLRASSPTFRKWTGVILSSENRKMLYIPKGFAHGFQTLENNSEVLYFISDAFCAESARGVCWNDPVFQIEWPEEDKRTISAKDQSWPSYHQQQPPWFT